MQHFKLKIEIITEDESQNMPAIVVKEKKLCEDADKWSNSPCVTTYKETSTYLWSFYT